MFERPRGGDRAVLVSLDFRDPDYDAKLSELRELVLSADIEIAAIVQGKRHRPDPATFAGSGKVTELALAVTENKAKPGSYNAVFYLRPHFQLEELTVSLRLVSQLPTPKK